VLTTVAATLATNPQPQLPGFLNAVGDQLNHYGYWAVLLFIMIEDFGIPVPGETILIAAAIFAGAGRLNIVAVGVIAFVAALLGDNIGFAIGHFGGRALALRWGKYVGLTEERLVKAEFFFEKHGGKIIIIARFIEGLRQANGIIAGISGMHWRRFLFFNAIGAGLWVGTWVSLGYFAGNHIDTIYHYITTYSYYVLIAVGVLVVALIVRHILRRRRRRADRGRAARESSEVSAGAPDTPGTQSGTEVHDSTGSQADSRAKSSAAAEGSSGARAGTEAEAGTEAKAGTGAQSTAEAQDAAGAQDAVEAQDAAEPQNGSGTQDGAETQKSAKTQSS
jgi:membrane protein DedA with SNARE-associated domain